MSNVTVLSKPGWPVRLQLSVMQMTSIDSLHERFSRDKLSEFYRMFDAL